MGTAEVMYDVPSYIIAAVLFAFILGALRLGVVVGDRLKRKETAASKSQANTVQGSLLGLLALLLGFTFSLSLGRFDQRSIEVVNEANAIGTAWLRTDLLDDQARVEARVLLRRYAELRLEAAQVTAADGGERGALVAEAAQVFERLWRLAANEARDARDPVVMGFVTSLNDMIDALASRDTAIARHVPELVLFLLFGTFVLLGAVVGYSSAITGARPGIPVYAMMVLIVVLVFLIIDLDRPRRGLIGVDQSILVSTVQAMQP